MKLRPLETLRPADRIGPADKLGRWLRQRSNPMLNHHPYRQGQQEVEFWGDHATPARLYRLL